MIGIYHSRDLDGWVSGAIIKDVYPDAEMIGYDYGEEFPWNKIPQGEGIIMADVSLSRKEMIRLGRRAEGKMAWIDHHKSSIDEMEGITSDVMTMVLDSTISACEGCWKYLVSESVPQAVELLGMYDSFRHKGTDDEQRVMMFQYYARSVASNLNDAAQFLNYSYDVERGIGQGKFIYQYLCTDVRYKYDRMMYPINFFHEGKVYKFAMMNGERINPVNFGIDYHYEGYDGAGCFWYVKGKGWTFSLYNDNGEVDCAAICKGRGGGGHKGAAGFITQDIKPYL